MPNSNPLVAFYDRAYGLLVFAGSHLQSPVLFFLRFFLGLSLAEIGLGKLLNIDLPIGYFKSLGIPHPEISAWIAGGTETFGGILIALGLFSRLISIPLIINFIVAYITAEQKALGELLGFDPSDFVGSAAFPYLAISLLILAFGPGAISIDYLIARWRKAEWKSSKL